MKKSGKNRQPAMTRRGAGARLSPGAARRGMSIAKLLVFLILVGVGVFVYKQMSQPPEARFRATRSEFSTPEGTLEEFSKAHAAYNSRSDPDEPILACMTEDDARWFRIDNKYVATSSAFGMAALVGSDSEQRHLALEFLLAQAPKSAETRATQTYRNPSDTKTVVFYDGGPGRQGKVRMVKDGENWKILHWFERRYCEETSSWIFYKPKSEETIEDKAWRSGGRYTYPDEVKAFFQECGAPTEPGKSAPSTPKIQNAEGSARQFIADYINTVQEFMSSPATAEQKTLDLFFWDDREWIEKHWQDICGVGAPGAQASKAAALHAIVIRGPISSNYEIVEVKTGSGRALVKITDHRPKGDKNLIVCLVSELDKGWKVYSCFFSRDKYFMPRIIKAKTDRGEALTSDELDYKQNGPQRFKEAMVEFYKAVGEPIPGGA